MNPHTTCATCLHNQANVCTNEASSYHGSPLKSWKPCKANILCGISAGRTVPLLPLL